MTDPHRGRELELMAAGVKRLAYLHHYPTNAAFPVIGFNIHGAQRWLVCADQYRPRAWIRTWRMYFEMKISLRTAHARRGMLLDYDKEDIRGYIRTRGLTEGLK